MLELLSQQWFRATISLSECTSDDKSPINQMSRSSVSKGLSKRFNWWQQWVLQFDR